MSDSAPKKRTESLRPISVSVSVAAELIGIASRSVWRKIDEGEIETVWIGRRRLVLYDSLEQFVRKQIGKPAPDNALCRPAAGESE